MVEDVSLLSVKLQKTTVRSVHFVGTLSLLFSATLTNCHTATTWL